MNTAPAGASNCWAESSALPVPLGGVLVPLRGALVPLACAVLSVPTL
jgi:hypothetical protein